MVILLKNIKLFFVKISKHVFIIKYLIYKEKFGYRVFLSICLNFINKISKLYVCIHIWM